MLWSENSESNLHFLLINILKMPLFHFLNIHCNKYANTNSTYIYYHNLQFQLLKSSEFKFFIVIHSGHLKIAQIRFTLQQIQDFQSCMYTLYCIYCKIFHSFSFQYASCVVNKFKITLYIAGPETTKNNQNS